MELYCIQVGCTDEVGHFRQSLEVLGDSTAMNQQDVLVVDTYVVEAGLGVLDHVRPSIRPRVVAVIVAAVEQRLQMMLLSSVHLCNYNAAINMHRWRIYELSDWLAIDEVGDFDHLQQAGEPGNEKDRIRKRKFTLEVVTQSNSNSGRVTTQR